MVFKIRKKGNVTNNYRRSREVWKNYINIVIGFFIDSHEIKFLTKKGGGDQFNSEMKDWSSRYFSPNALSKGNSIVRFTENKVKNPITHDDLRWCLDRFLAEKKLNGENAYQLSNLLKILADFNPNLGDATESQKYSLYGKKLGIIFDSFETYMKENYAFLSDSRNRTDYIFTYDSDDEGGNGGRDGEKKQGVDANTLGTQEEYSLDTIVHVTREIYKYFFEGKDLFNSKILICKLYNVYLSFDSNLIGKEGTNEPLLDQKELSLSDSERENLKNLVDYDFISDWKGDMQKDSIYRELYELLLDGNQDKRNALTKFFILLVKAEIKLNVDACPYFANLEIFKFANVMNIEDFKKVMESTKLTIQEYSEFPLLKHKGIKEVVNEFGAVPDRSAFIRSIEKKGEVVEQKEAPIQQALPSSLEEYLKAILHEGMSKDLPLYREEIVEGINRETLIEDDLRKAHQLLYVNHKPRTLLDNLNKFHGIYSLLRSNSDVNLNTNDLPELVYRRLIDVINENYPYNKEIYTNKERLSNLWKLIENASKELLFLESESGLGSPSLMETTPEGDTLYGVEVWKTGSYLIPLIEVTPTSMNVVLFGVIRLVPTSVLLDEGKFEYNNTPYLVNLDGVEPMVATDYEEDINDIARELDILMGKDDKTSTDQPLLGWLLESIDEDELKGSKSTTQSPIKRKQVNEPLSREDFMDGLESISGIF